METISKDRDQHGETNMLRTPGNSEITTKREAIDRAVRTRDTAKLVKLADSNGGLLDDTLRRGAWPLLLNAGDYANESAETQIAWRHLPEHPDEEQVQKDVDRAFVYYPKDRAMKAMTTKKASLSVLITRVLRTYPLLCYFQGYHDIAAVLLLVLGEEAAFPALANLSLFRIRDYMLPTIRPAEKHLLLIPSILKLADPDLASHIARIPVFYALAGTLTLYAHDIPVFEDITRLYDFLLAHEPVMAIYLFASIIIHRREDLFEIPAEDADMIHFTLTKLSQQLDLESLISQSRQLFVSYPPESLPHGIWWRIPSSSVLKTSRNVFKKQSLPDAESAIEQQKRLLAWEGRRDKAWVFLIRNRRPLLSVSTAVLVAAASMWMRRNGHDTALLSLLQQMISRAPKL